MILFPIWKVKQLRFTGVEACDVNEVHPQCLKLIAVRAWNCVGYSQDYMVGPKNRKECSSVAGWGGGDPARSPCKLQGHRATTNRCLASQWRWWATGTWIFSAWLGLLNFKCNLLALLMGRHVSDSGWNGPLLRESVSPQIGTNLPTSLPAGRSCPRLVEDVPDVATWAF